MQLNNTEDVFFNSRTVEK